MPIQITASACDSQGSPAAARTVTIDRYPNECPRCHVTIQPVPSGLAPYTKDNDWLEVYLRCSNRRCLRFIIAAYRPDLGRSSVGTPFFSLMGSLPWSPQGRQFAPSIVETSPLFGSIYNQAAAAEAYGLPDVAGPGFRKALEFLVKDYAIALHPDDAVWIRSALLAPVIAKHFANTSMAVVFSRAAWLGNDETHYERRWVDHDIDDLKKLIDASVHFIEMEKLVAQLPADMPNPKQNT